MRPSDDADRLPSPRGGPVLASTSKFEGPFSCHEPVIEIKDLDFYYSDKPVLNNVTLAITQGSCLALIGPNGSGKSTLCKILQGILAAPKTATTNVLGYPCVPESRAGRSPTAPTTITYRNSSPGRNSSRTPCL